jgi:hypothetical protein
MAIVTQLVDPPIAVDGSTFKVNSITVAQNRVASQLMPQQAIFEDCDYLVVVMGEDR